MVVWSVLVLVSVLVSVWSVGLSVLVSVLVSVWSVGFVAKLLLGDDPQPELMNSITTMNRAMKCLSFTKKNPFH